MEINGYSYPAVVLDLYAHGKKIQCNIVGDLAQVVDQRVLPMYQRPPVILLRYFKCKFDKDQVVLQNVVHVSRISINPDIKETVNCLNNCVCGHPIIGDDNVFRCQACSKDVEHFTVNYRVKVLIEDGTSINLFVFLLDAAVTKLIGKTCSDAFLVPDTKTQFSYCSPLFKNLLGQEKIFKVQRRKVNSTSYRETLKIVDVFGDASSFPCVSSGTIHADIVAGPVFTPIFPNYIPYERVQGYRNQVPTRIPIHVDAIKELLDDVVTPRLSVCHDHTYGRNVTKILTLKFQNLQACRVVT
ncbi:hypothetical protein PIB30_018299 [Stylosanthes scabra]|uniref:Replication factor A C-terminal domain-containing protein n=1 Tax=Stylosanthes scabra TaxID=79078 RepID=A0ABU6Y515_9FABA|nr:hypothetical protein [Stylosanthes scabra]